MTERPLEKLLRVLGGVALGYGPLGHQVLGQLLILDSHELEIAAASTIISAFSHHKNALVQTTVRVLAPAIAVHLLTQRETRRLNALWQQLEKKQAILRARETTCAQHLAAGERIRSRRAIAKSHKHRGGP